MTPDESIKRRAKKVVDAGSVTLAHFMEAIDTNDKLDALINKPDMEMPKPPEEMVVSNFPEVQKVEITNLPEEKDDIETQNLLKELVAEVKKKEQYAYDIEIDSTLKEQLRGEKGKDGVDGIDGADGLAGKDGSPDTPDQVIDKVNLSSKLINKERVEGLEQAILNGASNVIKGSSTTFVNGKLSKNINFTGATVTTQGDTSTVVITASQGSGDVVGPASATDTAIARYDTATGKLIKDSGITIADGATGTLSGTNTGDNATNTQYSGLAASKQDTLVSATNIKTVNGTTLLGAGDLATPQGTVTAVSVASANGVSGSSSGGATPVLTIALGAITPTTVNSVTLSGSATPTLAVTGTSSISGANTGDNATNTQYSGLVTNQTHTGDATGATALTVVALNGTSLAGLATGLLKNTTGTGVPSIAINSDLPAMSATVGGAVPTPPNNTTTFLRGDGTFATPTASATITTQDEGGTLSSTVTTLNFTGAGVTASGAGATTTINIPGGAGSFAIKETEVDFGTTPTTDKTFTVTDASITGSSKIMVTESGSTATGRVASGDSLWDSISYSCVPAAGSFTLYARASGSVVGYRKLFYTYS